MGIQYKKLLQSTSERFWEIDDKNIYIYSSEGVSNVLGFHSEELIGKTLFNFMNAEESQKVKKLFTLHALNKEPIVDFESIYTHKDGHKVTLIINAIPILDKKEDLVSFQGLAKYTSKKESESNILEERLALALRGSNDGIWDWNILDNTVYFSPRWKEMIGYSDEELPGELSDLIDRMHPDDIESTWANTNEYINSTAEYYEDIHRLKHKDGHWVWVLDRGKALYDSNGRATRMIGTHTDISEAKALQLKAIHQKQIIEQIHDSVISTDLGGMITNWNSGSEILLGYSSKEVIGKHISLVYLDEDLDILGKNITTLMKRGEKYTTVRLIAKSGEVLYADLSLSLLKDENDSPVGMVGYSKDITQKKKAEEMLAQQSRMAQMGEMISMIAHQWRQPLNAISLTASSLKLKFDFGEYNFASQEDFNRCSQDFSKGLSQIEEYTGSLSTTIDDFRNFFDRDKVPLFMKLENIVAKALNIIAPSLQTNDITIIEEYNSSQKIEVYENEVMQVILTLLQNAQDNFIERKTKEPSIKIIATDKTISVCDNGGGVPKNIVDKIFDPYFSTKQQKNGSGLGLYMSKTIIEQHHKAKLSVKNVDKGACFTVKFL